MDSIEESVDDFDVLLTNGGAADAQNKVNHITQKCVEFVQTKFIPPKAVA